jgi:Zn-dependent protease with chaperone function
MSTRPPAVFVPRCGCAQHGRRLFTAGLLAGAAWPAWAKKDLPPIDPQVACKDFGKVSVYTKVVSAEQVEASARQQYAQMLSQATSKRALAPESHPQVQRLRFIADRIVPFTSSCNPRAAQWKWEINVLGSQQLNAFCMPGGKIAFFHGILAQLQLDDDEVATIMGHEIAHALREHARERIAKTLATRFGANVVGAIFGAGSLGDTLAGIGGQLLTLTFSRDDETEADLVGMELAARAGYNPAAGVSLWQKMMGASKGAPPAWLSTHPSGKARIQEIQAKLPRVQPLFDAAPKPTQRFEPPEKPKPSPSSAR